MRALVIGLAATGEAVARRLHGEGWDLIVSDDRPGGDAYRTRVEAVAAFARVVDAPTDDWYRATVGEVELVAEPAGRGIRIRRPCRTHRPSPCRARSTSPPNGRRPRSSR
jgi:hypothetical protein